MGAQILNYKAISLILQYGILEKRVTHIYNQNNGHLITGYIKKLEIYQNLNGQRHPDFECSSFQMVGTVAKAIAKARPFENQII